MTGDGRPIGVFDSGVGGLSILSEIRSQLPDESVIYVADQRWAPYGERSLDEVRARSIQVAGQLIDAGAKIVVVACNSASAAALQDLREVYPATAFIGMEPAVKPAALESRSGVVGVIATAATFQGELFASVVDRHANGSRILAAAAPGLAQMVEDGEERGEAARALLSELLVPMVEEGMDTLVLGCTHYPFAVMTIRDVIGPDVRVVDPSPAIARQVGRVLSEGGLKAPGGESGWMRLQTTLDPERLDAAVRRLLKGPPPAAATRW
jgi:glutamate racemase